MNSANVPIDTICVIAANGESADNGKIFTYKETGWQYVSQVDSVWTLRGPQGEQGPKGDKGD